jgi:hypothetical protein
MFLPVRASASVLAAVSVRPTASSFESGVADLGEAYHMADLRRAESP